MATVRPRPPCLAAALAYLARGWSALALCPPDHQGVGDKHRKECRRPGKVPLGKWKEFQDKLPRPQTLELLWRRHPAANVGVCLGPVSKLVGVDVDNEQGAQLLVRWAGGGSKTHIPPTLSFKTPGGGHRLLYALPEGVELPIRSFREDKKEAVRILARGAQTVMPPSVNAQGKYEWLAGCAPADLAPAPCPQWLLDLLLADEAAVRDDQEDHQGGEVPPPAPRGQPAAEPRRLKRARAYLAQCEPAVSGQGGHNQTFKVACKLVGQFRLSEAEALDLLLNDYNPRCRPPWSDAELLHKVQSALQHHDEDGHMAAEPPPKVKPPPAKPKGRQAALKAFSTIERKEVIWLWPGWIPLGKVAVLDGDPGLGKSTVLLDLAARVSTNGMMPDGSAGSAGDVIIMSAEDAEDDTIKPRLVAAGAAQECVHFLGEIIDDGEDRLPEIPRDLPSIEEAIKQTRARLLIIDPLMAFLSGVDAMKDQDVRQALRKLARVANRQLCAVIVLRHLNKGNAAKAIYRGGGSIGIIGAARTGLLIAQDPDHENRRVFAVAKCNLAEKPASLTFRLDPTEGGVCRIAWTGTSPYTADQLVAQPKSAEERAEAEIHKGQQEIATEWLRDFLADGPKPIKECHQEAAKLGLTKRTVERAARQVCGKPRKFSGAWVWCLATDGEMAS